VCDVVVVVQLEDFVVLEEDFVVVLVEVSQLGAAIVEGRKNATTKRSNGAGICMARGRR
jgi:hypothetical protein